MTIPTLGEIAGPLKVKYLVPKYWKLETYFKETPYNKLNFFIAVQSLKGLQMMYSKIPLSFRETVPLTNENTHKIFSNINIFLL